MYFSISEILRFYLSDDPNYIEYREHMNMVKQHEIDVMKFHKRLDADLKRFQKEFGKVSKV